MASNTKFRINGAVDTSKNVMENINTLANESGCYVTWDPEAGKWSIIINDAFPSVKSFTDSNIIGEINVSGTGINELYNKVSVSYPHKDMRDTVDVVDIEIDSSERFANEDDNTLQLNLPHVNNTVQAQYIAGRELKQSRLDLIIEFRTNYEANELKAGELIEVTNSALDFSSKQFRIIQIDEEDTSDGNLIYSITAQEYDGTIYNASGINYEYRSNFNGIKSKVFNAEIEQSDEADLGSTMAKLLGANALLGIVNGLFKKFVTADDATGVLTEEIVFNDADTQKLMEAGAKKPPLTHAPADGPTAQGDGSSGNPIQLCPGQSTTLSVSHDCEVCFLTTPDYEYDYTITGLQTGEVNVPLEGKLAMSGANGSLTFTVDNISGDKTFNVQVGDNTTYYRVYDEPAEYVQGVTATPSSITEGQSTTINVATVGKTNGDTLNYTISGDTGSISTALTGTVTVTSNTASLTINTTDDSAFGATETCTVTFTPTAENSCSIANNTVTVTITNNATTGPQPPANTTCVYTQVPVVWCGEYDGTSGALVGITVKRYAYLPIPQAGESTVTLPATCSVSGGSISIDTTIDVASSGSMGGIPYQVITAFNSVAAQGIITGSSTTTVYGYDL
jgi:hypothetical protein